MPAFSMLNRDHTCDVCGKKLIPDRSEETDARPMRTEEVVGTTLCFSAASSAKGDRNYVQMQLGPYEQGRIYRVCCECLLHSLGVKP